MKLGGWKAQTDEENAKQSVDRAGFIEAHLVNQLLEHQRIIGKKIDAPFPIIEANGAGNDLADAAGVMTADDAMLAHHAVALVNRLTVPVLGFTAEFVHRVKTQIASLRYFRPQARCRGVALLCQLRVYFSVPFSAPR